MRKSILGIQWKNPHVSAHVTTLEAMRSVGDGFQRCSIDLIDAAGAALPLHGQPHSDALLPERRQ